MKKVIIYLFTILTLLSCSKTEKETRGGKPVIVTTTGMIADAVKNLVGDKAEVIALMGPGVDPHLYKATQGDLSRLSSSDVIIYNGLHLEGKMAELFEKFHDHEKNVYAMSDSIAKEKLRVLDAGTKIYDPHIWFDVALWKDATAGLAAYLKQTLPQLAGTIDSNSTKYLAELTALHTEVRNSMQSIPKEQRVLITAHDAFGYFGKAYDTEVRGLQGISTVSDFGLNDITALVNLIDERNIKAIFVETSVSDQSIKAVLDGCRQKGKTVRIGGTLYSDAMGNAGTPEGTYIGMVRKNVKTIVTALQ